MGKLKARTPEDKRGAPMAAIVGVRMNEVAITFLIHDVSGKTVSTHTGFFPAFVCVRGQSSVGVASGQK